MAPPKETLVFKSLALNKWVASIFNIVRGKIISATTAVETHEKDVLTWLKTTQTLRKVHPNLKALDEAGRKALVKADQGQQ